MASDVCRGRIDRETIVASAADRVLGWRIVTP